MTRIILNGCCGRMGHTVTRFVNDTDDMEIVAGVDVFADAYSHFPVFTSLNDVKSEADVIIDFSNSDCIDTLLNFALDKNMPVVIATTGFSDSAISKIKATAQKIPVFFTFNMSLGVNLITGLAKKAAAVLGDAFDIEIIEKHHNTKKDAPSGTAIMLANAINTVFDDSKYYEYDRHSRRAARNKNEIGIHSVRGGTIVGEHEIIFAGYDEVISIKHSAASRDIFAAGALRAAGFIAGQQPGLYDMNDLVNTDK